MDILQTLKNYGFSEDEANTYLCLLKHVEISAFRLAKETNIPRATVYRLLRTLENRGLVSSWKKNNVAYYTAESPKRLIKILEDKKEMINSILPDMLNLKGIGDLSPIAKIYVGIEGMKIVWDDILETAEIKGIKQIYAISDPKITAYLPKFFPQWLKRRENLGVFSYIISTNPKELTNVTLENNTYRETRLLPSNSPITGTIDIYGDKIAFFSLKEKEIYSVILESRTIAEMLRHFFISTWQLLEPQK